MVIKITTNDKFMDCLGSIQNKSPIIIFHRMNLGPWPFEFCKKCCTFILYLNEQDKTLMLNIRSAYWPTTSIKEWFLLKLQTTQNTKNNYLK